MAIDLKPILNVGLAAQSLALVGDNLHYALKKKKSVRGSLSQATKTLVGVTLIKAQSEIIGGL